LPIVPGLRAEAPELLGELHTLKGEARVLGLTRLATLAHLLEEGLSREERDDDVVTALLETLVAALDASKSERDRDHLLATALMTLGADDDVGQESEAEAKSNSLRPESGRAVRRGVRWSQVDAATVDELCDLLASLTGELGALHGARDRSTAGSSEDVDPERFRRRLDDALTLGWSLRLTTIEPTLRELGSHAKQLAMELGKSVEVSVEAGGVQIERDLLERILGPMLHLTRNAVDHGIEPPSRRGTKAATGRLSLRAEPRGASVVVQVEDDGRGIDLESVLARAAECGLVSGEEATRLPEPEVLELLFRPGFSTRTDVDALSGRGIGLDVVRRTVETWGGSVTVSTRRNEGTRFELSVPSSLSKERVLVVEVDGQYFGIPSRSVVVVEQGLVQGGVYRFRSQTVPARSLGRSLLGKKREVEPIVLVLRLTGLVYAVTAEHVVGELELVRRPTGPLLANLHGISASATLGDGRTCLILDPAALSDAFSKAPEAARSEPASTRAPLPRVLVADDSVVVRELIADVLTSAGFEVHTTKSGREALLAFEQLRPGLLISDVEMPEMDGFELLAAVRERDQLLPVIMLTARGTAEDRRKASRLGANAYIAKGEFKSDSLVDVVKRFYPGR
jgi:chemotaxis protein histidine kinase CheA